MNAIIGFSAGSEGGDSRCILVTILDDNIAEAEQSFSLQLASLTPNVFTVADNGGLSTVVIFDNEGEVLVQALKLLSIIHVAYRYLSNQG